MKLIQGILSCALAVGLMAFATNQAQAGVVIGNTLYSPLKIKLVIGTYNKNGRIKKVSITARDVLKMLGYHNNVQLAINTGSSNNNKDDVVVINKDSVLENLTAEGILTADVNELLDSSTSGNSGRSTYNSSGVLSLSFYSNPQFIESAVVPRTVNNPNLDQGASEDASDYWFEISGLYSYTETRSAINGGKQNISTSLSAEVLSGVGHDVDLNAPYTVPVRGDVAAGGSGSVSVD